MFSPLRVELRQRRIPPTAARERGAEAAEPESAEAVAEVSHLQEELHLRRGQRKMMIMLQYLEIYGPTRSQENVKRFC